jgi:hypothetical protein
MQGREKANGEDETSTRETETHIERERERERERFGGRDIQPTIGAMHK